jgi:hypothetical protein
LWLGFVTKKSMVFDFVAPRNASTFHILFSTLGEYLYLHKDKKKLNKAAVKKSSGNGIG